MEICLGDKSYMLTKTLYYDTIVKLLETRNKYVSGDQKMMYYESNTSSSAGKDLMASIRYGTSRDTGVAIVIGNNPQTNTIIDVDMGKQHANGVWVPAEDNKGKKLDKEGVSGIDAFIDPNTANANKSNGTGDKGRNGHEWQKADMRQRQIQQWLERKHEGGSKPLLE